MQYAITKEGTKQTRWNKGWMLTGSHRVVLRYLKSRARPKSEEEIWAAVKHTLPGLFRSNIHHAVNDLVDKGYIKSVKPF